MNFHFQSRETFLDQLDKWDAMNDGPYKWLADLEWEKASSKTGFSLFGGSLCSSSTAEATHITKGAGSAGDPATRRTNNSQRLTGNLKGCGPTAGRTTLRGSRATSRVAVLWQDEQLSGKKYGSFS